MTEPEHTESTPTADAPSGESPDAMYQGKRVSLRPMPRPGPPVTLTLPGTLDFDALQDGGDTTSLVADIERLADANHRARQASLDQLGHWFPGYDFDAASQTVDDRRFALLQIGGALFDQLDALATVESILSSHDLPGNRLRFSHGKRRGERPVRATDPARPQLHRPRVGPMVHALTEQWTVILNGVDDYDESLSNVVEQLERVYGCRVNTNVYASLGDARGFGPHWDQHDTIIVPAAGTKRWKVFEPATLSPLRPWTSDEVSPRPVWEGEISPGMCLVIPRGWGHEVLGSDDLAVHYTIGVNRVTVLDALERLSGDAGHSPLFRADLVYDPSRPATSYDRSVLDDDDALAATLAEFTSPTLVHRALATYRARMPLRLFPRLFDAWATTGAGDWSDATVRFPAPAGVHLVAASPGLVVVAVGDQIVECTRDAFTVLAALADAAPHRVADLDCVAAETLIDVLRDLVYGGLLDVRL